MLTPTQIDRYRWFRKHSGFPAANCLALARAEEWFETNEWDDSDHDPNSYRYPAHVARESVGRLRFAWRPDDSYDPNDCDCGPMPDIGWGGVLAEWNGSRWDTLESLWSVTFAGDGYPSGDPYARIVRAELCFEAMPDEPEAAIVIPDPCELATA